MARVLDNITLDRASLLSLEGRLCELLSRFLSFREHAIYFPHRIRPTAELIPAERLLITPVCWQGSLIAALRLEGVSTRRIRPLLPHIPALVTLCLENLTLAASLHTDTSTGLWSESALLDLLATKIDSRTADARAIHHNCFGLIILEWPNASGISRRAGPQTVAQAFEQMAEQLHRRLPEGCIAATLGKTEWRHEFGIYVNASDRGACHGLAVRLMENLERLQITDPFSNGHIPIELSAGHVLYPHDINGMELHGTALGQALLLRDRARLAAAAALHRKDRQKALAFAWVRQSGGVITQVLADNQLRVSLGQTSLAVRGMRFHVVPPGASITASKGQIIISQVGKDDSLATVFYWEQLQNPPHPGDQLILIRADGKQNGQLLTHGKFLEYLRHVADAKFSLVLSRFALAARSRDDTASLGKFLQDFINNENSEAQIVAGLYGSNGLALYLPDAREEAARSVAIRLHEQAQKSGFTAASGIFSWPCLNFARQDSEECALKALEYGSLLPPPHIGVLDALALTISADRKFSQMDDIGALAEYQLALLLNPDDAMIKNSLGVCLAALNRREDALRIFEEALHVCADKSLEAKICYNLGNIFNNDQDLAQAQTYFRRCVRVQNDHIYAWLRLGQIHAKTGHSAAARALYNHAAKLAKNDAGVLNMVERHLARLEAETSQLEQARERLHDSLLRDPCDAASMLMLAQTYINDDPPMAELLARKCLRLGADAFEVLADALAAQGRNEESSLARLRGKV